MKKMLLIIAICVISGIVGLGIKQLYHEYQFQKLYHSLLQEGVNDVLFLGRPTCGFCTLLKPILDRASNQYKFRYRYINTDWLTEGELEKVLNKLSIRKSTFSTPRILITEGKKVVDSHIGYMDDIGLFYYLKRNRLIDEKEVFVDPYSNIKRLTSQDYFQVLDQNKDAIILVGRIGDSKTENILAYGNKKKLTFSFLSPNMFEKEEDRKRFDEGLRSKDDNLTLPMLLIIRGGRIEKVIDNISENNIDHFIE